LRGTNFNGSVKIACERCTTDHGRASCVVGSRGGRASIRPKRDVAIDATDSELHHAPFERRRATIIARSITFRSSRMLPGQW